MGFVGRFLRRLHTARQALPDASALARSVCRVRFLVGQDSILVVLRIINDTIGIVSHDPTLAQLWRRLAALAFHAATRVHRGLLIRHPAFVICHLPSVIRHLPSVIRHLSFPIPRSEFRIPHFLAEGATHFLAPYFPNVSMGWDSSPRANQADEFGNFGYPFTNTISGNMPERFREALEIAHKRLLAQKSGPRVLTVNSWNEWTEGSCIEPDTAQGLKYLEAIRDVFGRRPES